MNGIVIPRKPVPPDFTIEQINILTEFTFLPESQPERSDLIFIFGAKHPKLGETASYLFNQSYSDQILISGGGLHGNKVPEYWHYGNVTEAEGIRTQLMALGVPGDKITIETTSTNSYENVVYSMKLFDFTGISSLIFVGRSYVAAVREGL